MKIKRIALSFLGTALCIATLSTPNKLATVAAAEDVFIQESGNELKIGNAFLSRTFKIDGNSIATTNVNNQIANKQLLPAEGSEDFIINTLVEADDTISKTVVNPSTVLDRSGWAAKMYTSNGTEYTTTANIFDGNKDTYVNEYTKTGFPTSIEIDLGSEQAVGSFSFLKRPGYTEQAYGKNGTLGKYALYISENGTDWIAAGNGEFTAEDYNLHQEGTLYNVGDLVYGNLSGIANTRYVKIVALSDCLGGTQEFTPAEVNLFSDQKSVQYKKVPSAQIDSSAFSATMKNKDGVEFTTTAKIFDNNDSTYVDESAKKGMPITLDVNLGEKQLVSSFSFQKRPGFNQAAYGKNGSLGKYELYTSEDGINWTANGSGEFTAQDYNLHQVDSLYNVGDLVYGNLATPVTTQYVRLVALSDCFGTQEFTPAEIRLYRDAYILSEQPIGNETSIAASDLTYKNYTSEDLDGGKQLTIAYEPYVFNGVTYTISYVHNIYADQHYMHSYLQVDVDNKEKATIDYIDLDHFVLDGSAEGVWSHPDASQVSSMWIRSNELVLGQPIYADGMFFGSEFPSSDTDIDDTDNSMHIRYYSGKNFTQLAKDGQLNDDGSFTTWSNVIGAAPSVDNDVVQTYFFDYINKIATPTNFRVQYNSWYDNMMGISDESISKSFYGAEKGLTQNGVRTLDAYVVDDGWNNYNDPTYTGINASSSGTTYNRTGFWEFNSKFPNELYTSGSLAKKLGSPFGLWLGPQGGYNYFGSFAKYLASKGTGHINTDYWTSVDVGSDTYVKNLTSLFIDYQNRFGISYWKLDGFALRPNTNSANEHMTGGFQNMYYTSDLWEKWTTAFSTMRQHTTSGLPEDLFINATCYVNLSPWLLPYVNTVWIQDSGDTGGAGTGTAFQKKITYRDQVYYKLLKQNQLQFPLKNIYNHDPIYGVSDGNTATTEDFRDFLMINATRGTAFWELYYSPSMMDDAKWKVNADVVDFAETNAHILEKAKMFGESPLTGVYGYSCWDGNEGIVSFRNPTEEAKTYSLVLSDVNGVPTTMTGLSEIQVHPYANGKTGNVVNYGDTIEVTLQPYETRIYQYGVTDTTNPEVISAKVTGTNTITLKFNERILQDSNNSNYQVNGKQVLASTIQADYRTVILTTEDQVMSKDTTTKGIDLAIQGVRDFSGNTTNKTIAINNYKDQVIVDVSDRKQLVDGSSLEQSYDANRDSYYINTKNAYTINTENSIPKNSDITVMMDVQTTATNKRLFAQGNDFVLRLDASGYVIFEANGNSVSSKEDVTTVVEKASGTFGTDEYVPTTTTTKTIGNVNDGETHTIAAVIEPNGTLKIYIDGRLNASKTVTEQKVGKQKAAQTMVLGDTGLNATFGKVSVTNYAYGYDNIEKLAATEAPTVNILDRSTWTATACSQMSAATGDGPASSAIDGKTTTWWHTNYSGSDTHAVDEHWIAINFGKTETFDTFIYTGRGSASNGSIKGYKLEAMIDNQWTLISTGEFSAEKVSTVYLDAPVSTDQIRLWSVTTQNGKNYAAAVEIEVGIKDRAATADELANIAAVNTYVENQDYTDITADTHNDLVQKAKALSSSSINNLTILQSKIDQAKANLIDAKALAQAIAAAEAIDQDAYEEDGVENLKIALAAAKEAKASATADDVVEAARTQVLEAMNQLEAKPTTEPADKTLLKKQIDIAETLVKKDYTAESWSNFETALTAAKAIYAKADATTQEVDEQQNALVTAILQLVLVDTGDQTKNEENEASYNKAVNELVKAPSTGDTTNITYLLFLLGGACAVILAKKKYVKIKK